MVEVSGSTPRPVINGENETVIEFRDDRADSMGRRRFFAYWLADNIGPAGDQHGVRGQVFFMNLDDFAARVRSRGRTLRIWKASDAESAPDRQGAWSQHPLIVDVHLPKEAAS